MGGRVFVFDAYGTLFDVAGAARSVAGSPSGGAFAARWPLLAAEWRRKQLEYTWVRSLMGAHADFAAVVADALDWAMEATGLHDHDLRARLLAEFGRLPCFPEVAGALAALKARGARLAILSNGTPAMIAGLCDAAGITGRFDALLSIEEAGLYKPAPAVYALATARFGVAPDRITFVSANGWDIAGAAHHGFHTVWLNRGGAPIDRLPHAPGHILPDLADIAGLA